MMSSTPAAPPLGMGGRGGVSSSSNPTAASSSSSTTSTTTMTTATSDPYLLDDFHPLAIASSEILSALRADESSPDADLYRRLISSTGTGAHRYHVAKGGEDGGFFGGDAGNGNGNGRGGTPSPSGSGAAAAGDGGTGRGRQSSSSPRGRARGGGGGVIGSPPAMRVVGGRGRPSPEPSGANNDDASGNANAGSTSPPPPSPPTPFLRYDGSLPLPAHLAAEASKARFGSNMGLLPGADLAWLSADEKLFLWSYRGSWSSSSGNEGNGGSGSGAWGSAAPRHGGLHDPDRRDYCSFKVPSEQCIVSVGLVRPKPGVFATCVEWCLVVTTPEEVMLCALAKEDLNDGGYDGGGGGAGGGFRHGPDSALRLVPTRFVLPTDSVPVTSVCGTAGGRIFLGGYDGSLYEMTYEGNRTSAPGPGGYGDSASSMGSGAVEVAIDDYFDGSGSFALDDKGLGNKGGGWSAGGGALLSGGKRVLSSLTFGSLDDHSGAGGTGRPRKCRRIDHSSRRAPGIVSHVIPPALVRAASGAASGLLGPSVESTARGGGPITSIVYDEERLCLYTLGSRGVICTYDVSPLPNASGGLGSPSQSPAGAAPPRLASAMDAPATARLYLDSVSLGRMYPPSTSRSNIVLGSITFPGGTAAAQAGVGGMEGARDVLRRHATEERAAKAAKAAVAARAGGRRRGAGLFGGRGDPSYGEDNAAGILRPVSIHIVLASQSRSLTLVAITGGGLRYYISSLSSGRINSAQQRGGGIGDPGRGGGPRPSGRMTLCHVRAPPPYATSPGCGNEGLRLEPAHPFSGGGGGGGGLPPGIHNVVVGRAGASAVGGRSAAGDVVKGCYGDGVFVLALDLDRGNKPDRSGRRPSPGRPVSIPPDDGSRARRTEQGDDAIVAALPDFAARVPVPASNGLNMHSAAAPGRIGAYVAPGGISEAVLLPMAGLGGTPSPVLPGGRTFDIVAPDPRVEKKSSVASLFVNSLTPSDVELQLGPLPSFVPRQTGRSAEHDDGSGMASRLLVVSSDRGRGVVSSALSALSFYLRSGQGYGREVGTVSQGSDGFGPVVSYRVSVRHGCGPVGFSDSARESLTMSRAGTRNNASGSGASGVSKSARLPPWLLRPLAAPLSSEASQHLATPGSSSGSDVLILNSGGLHFYANSSLLNNLASALLRASNVAKDMSVKSFFESYGYAEGCAMCFALSTSSSSGEALRAKAEQAALSYAHRPEMRLAGPPAGNGLDLIASYSFQPSSLYEGLMRFSSRLLRPFWYKPAVVVTEGRPIKSRGAYANYYAALPAKVELLLDDATLGDLRRPLALLQNLMKRTFDPAVKSVPGVSNQNANDAMDVDGDAGAVGGGLITRALQNQSRAAAQRLNGNADRMRQHVTAQELQLTARRTEERNMHSLYRLLSRCDQLLNLMSCLRDAHETPALPEVQWGLLHGMTFYQLVVTREGQGRIEALLSALVSRGEGMLLNGLSTDGDLLAERLSRQCYLFFSAASRLTYLGFRSANNALSRPQTSPQRSVLANQSASYLRAASRHWYSPALVAGRTMTKSADATFDEVAKKAMEAGSPLARAAETLMRLGNVEGLADVCLICASNFGGAKVPQDEHKEFGENDSQNIMLSWERGLYHRPPSETAAGCGTDSRPTDRSPSIVTGIDTTPSDALRTCHSIIFHYISTLLGDGVPSNQCMAEELVASCAASSDAKFLHSLYEHLLETNNAETALRIDSSSLENWLLHEKKDVGLLWKYYTFHGRNVLAGNIMFKNAMESENIPLDHRIECLTRAANSFSSALQANQPGRFDGGSSAGQGTSQVAQEQLVTADTLQEKITQIKEQLDVATIQKRVLTTVNQSQNADLDSAKMDDLQFTLVPVSDLYNNYASPLNLFDVCLLIMETCHHNNVDEISKLWTSILCEEVLPCSTSSQPVVEFLSELKQGSSLAEQKIAYGEGAEVSNMQKFENGEWIPRLRNRVATLGKELYGKDADYTFPVDLIVRDLEGLRAIYINAHADDSASQPWPAQALLDASVPFYVLFESYDSLQMMGNNAAIRGVDAATRFHWLMGVVEVLELWVTAALSSYGGSNLSGHGSSASSQLTRAVRTGGLLPRIDHYKESLQDFVGGSAEKTAIVGERLANVEDNIRKEFW